MSETPKIIDYEGSDYRTDFWEGRGRAYEDLVERAALQRLLPAQGRRLLEVGAGFGRLTREYDQYEQVVLLDYSFSQLQYARQQLGDSRYLYVAADAYRLPFRPGVFDGATMIRVIHHISDVPRMLDGLQRVLASDAHFILEFASKRNLKAMLRYALRRQDWSPYTSDPVEFVELNFDFHPDYIFDQLRATGFTVERKLPLSYFRLGALKQVVPARVLASLDRVTQLTGLLYSPSVITRNRLVKPESTSAVSTEGTAIFACPDTGQPLHREGDAMVSDAGTRYEIRDGIYLFKPLDG
ncbi:MAG: class I SAM-dependent methyltransferase [Chloroflexota bacterium]